MAEVEVEAEAAAQGRIRSVVEAVQEFAYIWVGVRAGLFDRIAAHGRSGVTPEVLAADLIYFEDYVRIWCQTAFAAGLLEDVGDGRLQIADGYARLLTSGSSAMGTLTFTEIVLEQARDFPGFMSDGRTRTRLEIDEIFHRFRGDGDDEGPRNSQLVMAERRIEGIYRQLPAVQEALEGGARVLEIGCGTGAMLELMAREFPGTSFVGVDLDEHSVNLGTRRITELGLDGRIRLEALGAEAMEFDEEFDLVSLNIVMHELLPAVRATAVANVVRALRSGGHLISNDFHYPDRLADFRNERHAKAVSDQWLEATWGNRHLIQDELDEMLREAGFGHTEFHEFSVPGRIGPIGILTSLARK